MIRSNIAAIILILLPTLAFACPFCDSATAQMVRSGILEHHFFELVTSLTIVILSCIVCVYGIQKYFRNMQISASVLLGIGLGGFLDGILFHQVFQAHSMLSNQLYPDNLIAAQINMFWDGVFHFGVWCFTVVGLGLLWRSASRQNSLIPGKALIFAMILGWGIFNSVEGLVDHQIFQLHHVIQRAEPDTQLLFDLLFLASGVAFSMLGWIKLKASKNVSF